MTVQKSQCNTLIGPYLKWPGGKRWLAPIIKMIVDCELSGIYYEPFLGAGAPYLAILPNKAILSDLNKELISCIVTVANHPEKVVLALNKYSNTKEAFYKARSERHHSVIAAAARFIYLNRTCWGGVYRLNQKGEFNVPFGNSGRAILPKVDLCLYAKLFSKAKILCSDFDDVMKQAVKGDVIYVDPPYSLSQKNNGFIRYNDKLFTWLDQIRLAHACKSAARRGAFIAISGLYHDDLLKLYKGWWALKLSRKTLISRVVENRREVFEILILSRKPRHQGSALIGLRKLL